MLRSISQLLRPPDAWGMGYIQHVLTTEDPCTHRFPPTRIYSLRVTLVAKILRIIIFVGFYLLLILNVQYILRLKYITSN